MLNFIKSEYYRMIHTTGIRVFFGILSVLTILHWLKNTFPLGIPFAIEFFIIPFLLLSS